MYFFYKITSICWICINYEALHKFSFQAATGEIYMYDCRLLLSATDRINCYIKLTFKQPVCVPLLGCIWFQEWQNILSDIFNDCCWKVRWLKIWNLFCFNDLVTLKNANSENKSNLKNPLCKYSYRSLSLSEAPLYIIVFLLLLFCFGIWWGLVDNCQLTKVTSGVYNASQKKCNIESWDFCKLVGWGRSTLKVVEYWWWSAVKLLYFWKGYL